MDEGVPCGRTRWQKISDVETGEEPKRSDIETFQPKCSGLYYSCREKSTNTIDRVKIICWLRENM